MIKWLVNLIFRILERMMKDGEKISEEERTQLARETVARMGVYNKFF